MVDPIEAVVYVAIVGLGIILALLPRSFMLPSLLIGLLLLVVGLFNEFGMTPVIDLEAPLADFERGLARLESRQVFGKVVVTF